MQDEVTIRTLITVPLKGWNSSDIWEKILTHQNSIQEEIKSRVKSKNVCYLSV
jgi:3'-phosphoadenosine 5'-phosphosulfate sulfotransferase (PAPS reductase)/FAD synthetase